MTPPATAQANVGQQGEAVLVPRVPTPEMVDAGNGVVSFTKLAPEVWSAMLAAAPASPAPAAVAATPREVDALRYLLNWSDTRTQVGTVMGTFTVDGDQKFYTKDVLESLWCKLSVTASPAPASNASEKTVLRQKMDAAWGGFSEIYPKMRAAFEAHPFWHKARGTPLESDLPVKAAEVAVAAILEQFGPTPASNEAPGRGGEFEQLRLHVTHLIYAIDRGYFGDNAGLRESAFVEPLRAFVMPGFEPVSAVAAAVSGAAA